MLGYLSPPILPHTHTCLPPTHIPPLSIPGEAVRGQGAWWRPGGHTSAGTWQAWCQNSAGHGPAALHVARVLASSREASGVAGLWQTEAEGRTAAAVTVPDAVTAVERVAAAAADGLTPVPAVAAAEVHVPAAAAVAAAGVAEVGLTPVQAAAAAAEAGLTPA